MNTVVLTGPTGYLGKAILFHLLDSYNVIGISRSASNITVDDDFLQGCHGKYIPLDQDLSVISADALSCLISECLSDSQSFLVGLVNNAFTYYPNSSLSVDTNSVHFSADSFLGVQLRLSFALSELLKSSQGGSIVNISSMYGKVSPRQDLYPSIGSVNPILYGAFKAALIQATKYMSSLLAPDNIRVNSVSYGPFPSPAVQKSEPEFIKKLALQTHLGRIADAHEAAGVIAFLLSSDSSYVTGADISVDGGWTAW